jgi:hypothetical protein
VDKDDHSMTDGIIFENKLSNRIFFIGLSFLAESIILGLVLFDGIWSFFFLCVGIGLTILLLLLIREWVLVPLTITVVDGGFYFVYLTRIKKYHSLEEVVWLNTWPGSIKKNKPSISDRLKYVGPYSGVMLMKETVHPHHMPYEAGKMIKRNFVRKFGIAPPNYEQYIKKTGDIRWVSIPPSEENSDYRPLIESVPQVQLQLPKRRLKGWMVVVAALVVPLVGGICLFLLVTFWP